jgi:hypothetical protein
MVLSAIEGDLERVGIDPGDRRPNHPLLVRLVDVQRQVPFTERADRSRLSGNPEGVAEQAIPSAVERHQVADW